MFFTVIDLIRRYVDDAGAETMTVVVAVVILPSCVPGVAPDAVTMST